MHPLFEAMTREYDTIFGSSLGASTGVNPHKGAAVASNESSSVTSPEISEEQSKQPEEITAFAVPSAAEAAQAVEGSVESQEVQLISVSSDAAGKFAGGLHLTAEQVLAKIEADIVESTSHAGPPAE